MTAERGGFDVDPCGGTGLVPCWNPGGPCSTTECDLCGICQTCRARPEQDGLDLARTIVTHEDHVEGCWIRVSADLPTSTCLPYRLAALALDLQGKVARAEEIEVQRVTEQFHGYTRTTSYVRLDHLQAALADQLKPDPYQRSVDL